MARGKDRGRDSSERVQVSVVQGKSGDLLCSTEPVLILNTVLHT